MYLNLHFTKVLLLLSSLLISSLAEANVTHLISEKPQPILFELDLNDEEVSTEGASLKLYQNKYVCLLNYSLYGETGQVHYQFEFYKTHLLKTLYQDYAYKYGDFAITNDRDGIEKFGEIDSNPEMIRLVESKVIYPEQDQELVAEFKRLYAKIPQQILKKYCN